MDYIIKELNDKEVELIEEKLEEFDKNFMGFSLDGGVKIGVEENGKIIAGLDGVMTAFKILYVSTVFVDEKYRSQGIGRSLMKEMEKQARIRC